MLDLLNAALAMLSDISGSFLGTIQSLSQNLSILIRSPAILAMQPSPLISEK
jgi:hypothetical protein